MLLQKNTQCQQIVILSLKNKLRVRMIKLLFISRVILCFNTEHKHVDYYVLISEINSPKTLACQVLEWLMILLKMLSK